jgi:hypothetical protein
MCSCRRGRACNPQRRQIVVALFHVLHIPCNCSTFSGLICLSSCGEYEPYLDGIGSRNQRQQCTNGGDDNDICDCRPRGESHVKSHVVDTVVRNGFGGERNVWMTRQRRLGLNTTRRDSGASERQPGGYRTRTVQ